MHWCPKWRRVNYPTIGVADRSSPATVLVTGGSSGIGRALVEELATRGYTVCFTYRTGKARARDLVHRLGGNVKAFFLDLGEYESIATLVDELPGDVQILVNNAGLGSATVTEYASGPHEQDQALMQVNAVGTLWLTQKLVPRMVAAGCGKVVFVSSVDGGIAQFPGFKLADGMSKAALAFLGRQLAAELAHSGVDVFTICPGATATPMFESSTLEPLPDRARAAFIQALPKRRLIDAGEIARVVAFLLTDEARVLHGAVIDASLGLGVRPGIVTEARTEPVPTSSDGADGF